MALHISVKRILDHLPVLVKHFLKAAIKKKKPLHFNFFSLLKFDVCSLEKWKGFPMILGGLFLNLL